MLHIDVIQRSSWEWGNDAGTVFSRDFQFLPDGRIGGYEHPNEHRWQYEDGKLTLFDTDGHTSAILYEEEDERLIKFAGKFLKDSSGQTRHVLSRLKATVGCFLRTHFWDNSVATAYERMQAAWSGEVGVTCDQTNPFEVPSYIKSIGHSIDDFDRLGLSSYPSKNRMLWHNGDYPLYHLALNTDHDYFIVCEYDLALNNIDLRAMVEKMIADDMDWVGMSASKLPPDHFWFGQQDEWLKGELKQANSTEKYDVAWTLFPFVFISRKAAMYLLARRIHIAHLYRSGKNSAPVPFCETFVPTEILRGGYKMADLSAYAPGTTIMGVADVRSWKEVAQSSACMIHPVLMGDRFARLLLTHGRRESQREGTTLAGWLRVQLSRPMDDVDRSFVENVIASLC